MNYYPIILSSITAITWGISNGYMKYPSIALGSARAIASRQLGMCIILFSVNYLYSNLVFSNIELYWFSLALLLGVFGYFPFMLFCQALQSGSVGVVNAIGNSFPVIVVILSYLFLDLRLSFSLVLGVLLTTFGIALLSIFSLPEKKLKTKALYSSRQVTIFSLLACLLWGVFFTLSQIPNRHLGFLKFSFGLQLGSFISAYMHLFYEKLTNKKKLSRSIGKKSLKTIFFAAVTAVTGSVCYYKALSMGNPGMVTAIAGCSPVVGAIFGKIVYNEKLGRVQKYGIFLTVLGVVILGSIK